MRIRKRQVPLPLSSLSPVPLSDYLPNRSAMVQRSPSAPLDGGFPQYQQSDQLAQALPPIADLRSSIGRPKEVWICSGARDERKEKEKDRLELEREEPEQGRRGKIDDGSFRKGSISFTESVTGLLPLSSSPHSVGGRWCGGDITVPLKKRRGSYIGGRENEGKTTDGKEKKMKSKTNKKCVSNNGTEEVEEEEGEEEEKASKEGFDNGKTNLHVKKKKKKNKRGGAIMEGSRCSRVNGRGWRCCQQTLVGYSLCEHHLGKGRLRSISNNAPAISSATTTIAPTNGGISTNEETKYEEASRLSGVEDRKKPLTMITTKGKKIGMVKARSISSLLGLDDNVIS